MVSVLQDTQNASSDTSATVISLNTIYLTCNPDSVPVEEIVTVQAQDAILRIPTLSVIADRNNGIVAVTLSSVITRGPAQLSVNRPDSVYVLYDPNPNNTNVIHIPLSELLVEYI